MIKKLYLILSISLVVFISLFGLFQIHEAKANSETIHIEWNGTPIIFPDQQPIMVDGIVVVPLRTLVAYLPSYEILKPSSVIPTMSIQPSPNPNIAKPKLMITLGKKNVIMTDAMNTCKTRILKQAPFIKNGRAMISVRAFGEAFGTVNWHADTKTVEIRTTLA